MYVVNESCLGCRFGDCIAVCPVRDCFKIGANMVVIDPDMCIDCGLCVNACPAKAITHDSIADLKWLLHNAKYAKEWPAVNANECGDMKLPNARELCEVENKSEMFDATASVVPK